MSMAKLVAKGTAIVGTGLLAAGTIFRYRDSARLKPFAKRDISGQTVLVTGGTTGIGYAVVKGLVSSGAKIITCAPDRQRGLEVIEELKEAGAVDPMFFDLDLRNKASITQCCNEIKKASNGNLSMIINNAGMMSKTGDQVDGLEQCLSTNILGPFLLTMLLLPEVLRNSSRYPGRIIQTGSRTEQFGMIDLDEIKKSGFTRAFDVYDGEMAYADSKLAIVLFTRELQRRLEINGSDVTALCVTPGMVCTAILPPTLSWKVLLIYPFYNMFARSPVQGAHGILQAALAHDVEGGSFTWDGLPVASQSDISKDPELAKGFWEVARSIMCPDMELPV